MKKKLSILFLSLFFFLFLNVPRSSSDELADISKQINDLTGALNESIKATKPLESQLKALQDQVAGIKNRVAAIDQDIVVKKKSIDDGYKNLAKQQVILNKAISGYYIKSYYFSPIMIFLSSTNASDLTRLLAYQRVVTNNDKIKITNIALAIQDLENRKLQLEQEQQKLTVIKADLDVQSAKLDKIVAGAKDYQSKLSGQIAQLSAKQQEIIAAKQGSLNLPRTAAGTASFCTDDRKMNPGFTGGFAFFSFGIPHYVGMNQYGAYGRAKSQDYKTILNAYYQNINIECRSLPSKIAADGYGELDFEDYIKGVVNKEMGADLSEALKAQAVAARSYAISYTGNGTKSICTSQSCQAYSDSRRGGASDAVEATGKNTCGDGKGEVMTSNGEVITAWFASTFGGYAHRSSDQLPNADKTSYTKNFADTTGPVSSFSDLFEKAYDKDSPCFYSAQGWRNDYGKSAWLKPDEVADIANVILLTRADSSTGNHLFQLDKPNPAGTDNWDFEKVKQELSKKGISPFTTVSDISISADFNSGFTTNVQISGGGKSESFSGSEFKNFFNLRAPANINIVGPLYNVERN